ncbi:MAG: class I SAM-dependent methyltransferase family protein [Candidatus Micrarchaeaceae archaeon]
MLYIKAPKNMAEKIRKELKRKGLLAKGYNVIRKNSFIYFPLFRIDKEPLKGYEIVKMKGEGKIKKDFNEILHEEMKGKERHIDSKSFDIVGDIAIIDVDKKYSKSFAKALMRSNKRIATVVRKAGPVKGIYRKRDFEYVYGKRKYETIYAENGCRFVVNLRKFFFSPRFAFERSRVAAQIKKRENVVVMFAGAGFFPIEIAKKGANVLAIEINKEACKYMEKNAAINKVSIEIWKCDAKEVEKRKSWADRIIMPHPKGAYEFIDYAIKAAKQKCKFHYYFFSEIGKERDYFDMLRKKIEKFGKVKLELIRKVRPYSAKESEYVVDFLLEKEGSP